MHRVPKRHPEGRLALLWKTARSELWTRCWRTDHHSPCGTERVGRLLLQRKEWGRVLDCCPPVSSRCVCSVISDSLQPHGLLCPWDSPGKSTGVGCPPPGDLPDPVMEPGSPALQADSFTAEPPGEAPNSSCVFFQTNSLIIIIAIKIYWVFPLCLCQ